MCFSSSDRDCVHHSSRIQSVLCANVWQCGKYKCTITLSQGKVIDMCTDIIGAILYAYLISTTHDSYSSVTVTLHILRLTYFSINEDHFAT